MPTTELPESKEKAHDISRKIANERPSRRDKDAPENNVSGGFNQKRDEGVTDQSHFEENSATDGDGQ